MDFRNSKVPVFSFGTIVFAFGVVLFVMQWVTQGNRLKVNAIITDIEERSWADSTGAPHFEYYANLKFKSEKGDTATGYLYTNNKFDYKPGNEIKITYKVGEQRVYTAKSILNYFWFGGVVLLGIGIMVLSFNLKSEKFDEV
jgi:hypothetical protein